MTIQTYYFYQPGSIDGIPGTFNAGTAVDINTATMSVVATRPIGSTVPTIIQLTTNVISTALTPYISNPTQTASAGADTTYSFGTSGTSVFNHVAGQNNSPANIYLAFDQSTTVSGNQVYVVAAGQPYSFDRPGTVLHFSSPSPVAFGGISGITVEAFP